MKHNPARDACVVLRTDLDLTLSQSVSLYWLIEHGVLCCFGREHSIPPVERINQAAASAIAENVMSLAFLPEKANNSSKWIKKSEFEYCCALAALPSRLYDDSVEKQTVWMFCFISFHCILSSSPRLSCADHLLALHNMKILLSSDGGYSGGSTSWAELRIR